MTRSASHAISAYQHGQRRRNTTAALDHTAEGIVAVGGLLATNAALSLNMGLVPGRAGLSIGISMLCAGVAWFARGRRRSFTPQPVRVARAARPIYAEDHLAA